MGALMSECGRYRYRLDREMGCDSKVLLYIMLNPSTACATVDDPTIRKCKGFALRLGYERIRVVNLYAFRATNPADLDLEPDPVGPDNDGHLRSAMATASAVIVAWGAHRAAKARVPRLLELAGPHPTLCCLGTSKDGSPRHPLMLPYTAPLQDWTPPQ